jgi:hypothetical protein
LDVVEDEIAVTPRSEREVVSDVAVADYEEVAVGAFLKPGDALAGVEHEIAVVPRSEGEAVAVAAVDVTDFEQIAAVALLKPELALAGVQDEIAAPARSGADLVAVAPWAYWSEVLTPYQDNLLPFDSCRVAPHCHCSLVEWVCLEHMLHAVL